MADFGQKGFDVQCHEGVFLQIDHIDPSRRISEDVIDRNIDLEMRFAGGDKHRVVVAHPVDRPSSQAGDDAQQAVLPADPRRPAEFVAAESHAGKGRKKIFARPPPDDLLDHDAHFLIEIQKSAFGSIGDRIGTEDRGIDLGHGVEKGFETLFLVPPVGQKEAFVFSRKRRSQTVFKKARASDDERNVSEVVEGDGQALDDFLGKGGVFEQLDDMGILLADDVDILVFLLGDFLEVVIVLEINDPVRCDVPGFRGFDLADGFDPAHGLTKNPRGQKQAGALPAEFAVASRRIDQAFGEPEEILDRQVFLGDVDELELLVEKPADE